MTTEKLVSVIIVTYNRAQFLKDAIQSVLNQTYRNIQLILVDDGSTDNTKELAEAYPFIEYHYKNNGGQASARNLGFKYAKGDFVACLDSDDMWYPDFLTICVKQLTITNTDFVFTNWDQEVKNGVSWQFLNRDPFLKPYLSKLKDEWVLLDYADTKNLYLRACPSPSSSVVFRKSSMVEGWDEQMKIGDDWSMYLDIIFSKNCNVAFTLKVLWRKRVNDINVYDGRKWNEVLENLYVNDLSKKISKLKSRLNRNELDILNKRYIESMVELAKHNIVREYKFLSAMQLLKRSFIVDISQTLISIPLILRKAINSKIIVPKDIPN